jgi:hypothetical protein
MDSVLLFVPEASGERFCYGTARVLTRAYRALRFVTHTLTECCGARHLMRIGKR